MKKTILIITILTISLLLITGCAKKTEQSTNVPITPEKTVITPTQEDKTQPTTQQTISEQKNITIKGFMYKPVTLIIKKGTTVTWTNQDTTKHTITSDKGEELDSQLLTQGQSYSHTFNTAGYYPYHCIPHPYMKGDIVVE